MEKELLTFLLVLLQLAGTMLVVYAVQEFIGLRADFSEAVQWVLILNLLYRTSRIQE